MEKSVSATKPDSSPASRSLDPHAERQRTAQEFSRVLAAQQLIADHGKDEALQIADLVFLLCGGLRHGSEINDEEPLRQMFRLIETERDAKGQRISAWAAAQEVAKTMPGHSPSSTAKRLLAKYNATLARQAKIEDLFR